MAVLICTLHHHIGQESVFERGLNVSTDPEIFEAQINYLSKNYDIIDLDTLLSGRLPRRPLLITFDDNFRSVLDAARDILAPKGLPALLFVNPGLFGQESISLDGTIAWAVAKAGAKAVCGTIGIPPREGTGQIVQEMSNCSVGERTAIKGKLLDTFGPPELEKRSELLNPADLALLVELGIEVGNHTMTHVHCRALDAEELETEIVSSKEKIEDLTGRPVRAFSVPYGHEDDLTPELLRVLRSSGHGAIFLVHARSNSHRPAPDIWYRTSLQNQKPSQLWAKLRFAPFLRTVKSRAR